MRGELEHHLHRKVQNVGEDRSPSLEIVAVVTHNDNYKGEIRTYVSNKN